MIGWMPSRYGPRLPCLGEPYFFVGPHLTSVHHPAPPTTHPHRETTDRRTKSASMFFASAGPLRGSLLRLTTATSALAHKSAPTALARSFASVPNALTSRFVLAPRRLLPGAPPLLHQTPARGMKVRASVKKLCDGCMVCATSQDGDDVSASNYPQAQARVTPRWTP